LMWFNQTLDVKTLGIETEYCFPISIRPRGEFEAFFFVHFYKAGERAIIESDVDFTLAVEVYDKSSSTVTFAWKFSSAHTFPSNLFFGKVIGARVVSLSLSLYSSYGYDKKDSSEAFCPSTIIKLPEPVTPALELKPFPEQPISLVSNGNAPDAIGPIDVGVVPDNLPIIPGNKNSNGNSNSVNGNTIGNSVNGNSNGNSNSNGKSNGGNSIGTPDNSQGNNIIGGGSNDSPCLDCDGKNEAEELIYFNEIILMILLPLCCILFLTLCCVVCCRRVRKQQKKVEQEQQEELEAIKDHHPGSFFAPTQLPVMNGQGIQYVVIPPSPWLQQQQFMEAGQQFSQQQYFGAPPFAFQQPLSVPHANHESF